MHRALTILEILTEIYSYIISDGDRHTLCSLARTCRTLSDPALDLIWEWINNLEVILQTIPSYVKINDAPGHLSGDVTEEDWMAFNRHSRQIVYMQLDDSNTVLDVSIFHAFSRIKPNAVLFPRLRELAFDPTALSPRAAALFIGPNLEGVEIRKNLLRRRSQYEPSLAADIEHFLDILLAHTPRPDLYMLIVEAFDLGPERVSQICSAFPKLEHLELGLTPQKSPQGDLSSCKASKAFSALFSMEHLDSLLLTLDDRIDTLDHLSKVTPGPCYLKLLDVAGALASIASLLDVYKLDVQQLIVGYFEFVNAGQDTWDALFMAMYRCFTPNSVMCITVDPAASVHRNYPMFSVIINCRALLSMPTYPALTALSLDVPLDITDEAMAHIARSCPALVTLSLEVTSMDLPSIGVASLHALARACPQLQSLVTPINPALPYAADASDTLQQTPSDSKLAQFSIVNPWPSSDERSVPSFAATVDRLFPSVKEFGFAVRPDEDEVSTESLVQTLRGLQIARGCPESEAVTAY